MLQSLTPNIIVADVNKSLDFYTDILNFKVIMAVNEDGETIHSDVKKHKLIWALIEKDEIQIMFQYRESIYPEIPDLKMYQSNFNVFFITADNIEKLYTEIKDKVEVIKEIHETFYGTKEFIIKDPFNTFIFFAQR